MSEINLGIDIKASAATIYNALIDSNVLANWFAEQTEIAIEEERYDFWGHSTPGNPGREQGRHKVLRSIPEKLIEFEWRYRESDTVVQYEIHKRDNGCVLTMFHRGLPKAYPGQSSMIDFWSHSLEGLRHWLEKGRAYELFDYSTPPMGDVRVEIDIDVAPSAVFHALTDPIQMERWVGSKGSIDPKVGGKIDFGWGMGPKKILEIAQDEKLKYSWQWEGQPETVTTWSLNESNGKTRVTIVQSGFAPNRDGEDYFIGWSKFAARLKTMLEEGPEWEHVRVYANEERADATTTTIDKK